MAAHLLPGHGHVLQQLVNRVRHKLERSQVHTLVVPAELPCAAGLAGVSRKQFGSCITLTSHCMAAPQHQGWHTKLSTCGGSSTLPTKVPPAARRKPLFGPVLARRHVAVVTDDEAHVFCSDRRTTAIVIKSSRDQEQRYQQASAGGPPPPPPPPRRAAEGRRSAPLTRRHLFLLCLHIAEAPLVRIALVVQLVPLARLREV